MLDSRMLFVIVPLDFLLRAHSLAQPLHSLPFPCRSFRSYKAKNHARFGETSLSKENRKGTKQETISYNVVNAFM